MNRVEAIGERLVSAIQAPISLNDRVSLQLNVCIGISTFIEQHSTIDGVLGEAETAIYVAKCSETSKSTVVSVDIEDQIKERNSLQADLRHAVETGYGLSLVYQPIFDLRTGMVTAREALTRWTHPKRGAIPPSIFIPLAEELGLIDALGTWVINNACFQAKEWHCDSRIAVNVSCLQLCPGFADRVLGVVSSNELCPNRLEIEITESVLSEDSSIKLENLKHLKRAGVKIALDDFGGGVSSFGHVRTFPFDRIKIEGSFVRHAISRPDCAVIVGIIADLGKRLDVVTVAKGIETPKHLELVRQHGCDEAQGYFLGRPSIEG